MQTTSRSWLETVESVSAVNIISFFFRPVRPDVPIRLFNIEVQRKTFGVPENYIIKTESVQSHVISRLISVERFLRLSQKSITEQVEEFEELEMLLKASLVHHDDLILLQSKEIQGSVYGIAYKRWVRYYNRANIYESSRAIHIDVLHFPPPVFTLSQLLQWFLPFLLSTYPSGGNYILFYDGGI